jgi:hypothetical protein
MPILAVAKRSWNNGADLYQPPCDLVLDIDRYRAERRGKNPRKVLLQMESPEIEQTLEYQRDHGAEYDLILTYHEEILRRFPHARRSIYANSWMAPEDYRAVDSSRKKAAASFPVGAKVQTSGHRYRQVLLQNHLLLNCAFPVTFFTSWDWNPPLPSQKLPQDQAGKKVLFGEFQFSFVVENCRHENYFTEKLIDCLIMKTLPVFWGDPNIDLLFDTSGWIILETMNPEEVLQKLGAVAAGHYARHAASIEANYQKSLRMNNYTRWLGEALEATFPGGHWPQA